MRIAIALTQEDRVTLEAIGAWNCYAARNYVDAHEHAATAAFVAWYLPLTTSGNHDIWRRALAIRAACRARLQELVAKGLAQWQTS